MINTRIIGLSGVALLFLSMVTDDMMTSITAGIFIISSQLWMLIEK